MKSPHGLPTSKRDPVAPRDPGLRSPQGEVGSTPTSLTPRRWWTASTPLPFSATRRPRPKNSLTNVSLKPDNCIEIPHFCKGVGMCSHIENRVTLGFCTAFSYLALFAGDQEIQVRKAFGYPSNRFWGKNYVDAKSSFKE
jgi:hypothetical protein